MYFIRVRYKDENKSPMEYICTRDGLFELAYILDRNDYVVEFTVSSGYSPLMPNNFNFSGFNKWVTKLFQ